MLLNKNTTLSNSNPNDTQLTISLNSDDNLDSISQDLTDITLITLNFPKYSDGRAFTQAHLLRSKYNYKGHLRAIGNPIADQAQFLFRCGFDSIQIPDNQNPKIWIEESTRMSRFYQRSEQNSLTNSRY